MEKQPHFLIYNLVSFKLSIIFQMCCSQNIICTILFFFPAIFGQSHYLTPLGFPAFLILMYIYLLYMACPKFLKPGLHVRPRPCNIICYSLKLSCALTGPSLRLQFFSCTPSPPNKPSLLPTTTLYPLPKFPCKRYHQNPPHITPVPRASLLQRKSHGNASVPVDSSCPLLQTPLLAARHVSDGETKTSSSMMVTQRAACYSLPSLYVTMATFPPTRYPQPFCLKQSILQFGVFPPQAKKNNRMFPRRYVLYCNPILSQKSYSMELENNCSKLVRRATTASLTT